MVERINCDIFHLTSSYTNIRTDFLTKIGMNLESDCVCAGAVTQSRRFRRNRSNQLILIDDLLIFQRVVNVIKCLRIRIETHIRQVSAVIDA